MEEGGTESQVNTVYHFCPKFCTQQINLAGVKTLTKN